MKKNLLSMIITLILLSTACKESTTEPLLNKGSSDFFPNSDRNYYYYNILADDSSGLVQSGTRKSYYSCDTTLLLTQYQIKVDTFQTDVQSITQSYFRKSLTGIFNFVSIDTTKFLNLVPDSLRGGISFDSEYRLLYQPLSLNQFWPVYKVTADYMIYQFDFFTVDAKIISNDTVILNFQDSSETKSVYKIRYQAKVVTDITLPPTVYECFAWVAENIGFIRWEGDSEIINFFAGASIYPANTNVTEELYSYKTQ